MVREGGFHPFKGRVSRHFGDSVRTHSVEPPLSGDFTSFFWWEGEEGERLRYEVTTEAVAD